MGKGRGGGLLSQASRKGQKRETSKSLILFINDGMSTFHLSRLSTVITFSDDEKVEEKFCHAGILNVHNSLEASVHPNEMADLGDRPLKPKFMMDIDNVSC